MLTEAQSYPQTREKMKILIEKIDRLPTVPDILSRVLAITDNPDSTSRDLMNVIVHDPAISAKVISIANSSYYSFANRVVNLSHAISLLGFNVVKNITIGLSVFSCFHDPYSPLSNKVNDLYIHSFAVGFAADGLAKRTTAVDSDSAFLTGLLHDIGKMVLIKLLDLNYNNILEIALDQKKGLERVEKEVLGFDHADAGAWLVKKWGLPDVFVTTVQHHHVTAPEVGDMRSLIALCDALIRQMGFGNGGNPEEPRIDPERLRAFSLSEQDISNVREQIDAAAETICELGHS